jgi:tRNA pseudouridine38-40 synthase
MTLAEIGPETKLPGGVDTTTKIVLVVEYDGTAYFGFQFQADRPTVQDELEKAIFKLTQEKLRVVSSSRTDTGVHASSQVVCFRTKSLLPMQTFVKGLNYYLPKDIAVKAAHQVREPFDIQRRALSREYRYLILTSAVRSPLYANRAWQVFGKLDIEAMNRACQLLLGEHDFASFYSDISNTKKNTVRKIYGASVSREGELVTFKIIGSSFLTHQVRNTVGALVKVGQGKMTIDEFGKILEAKKPGSAGPMAPACGLCLVQVNYPRPFEEEL